MASTYLDIVVGSQEFAGETPRERTPDNVADGVGGAATESSGYLGSAGKHPLAKEKVCALGRKAGKMIITFLGTAAAEAYPDAFCRCDNCERARALGGPSLRKRSEALINDDLLIDLGPDIMTASFMHGRSLASVRYCLQTHAHADHLDPSHLFSRSPEYGVADAPCLHFYASPATARRTAQLLERDCAPGSLLDPEVGERLNLEIHQIEALQSFAVGPTR